MLDHLFKKESTRTRHRATVFGPYLDDYLNGLRRQGYGRKVLLRDLVLIMRFGEYLAKEGVHVAGALAAAFI